jgi:hypothetical protein
MQFIVKVQIDLIAVLFAFDVALVSKISNEIYQILVCPFPGVTAFREALDTNIGRAEIRRKALISPPRFLHVYLRRKETYHGNGCVLNRRSRALIECSLADAEVASNLSFLVAVGSAAKG